ncbi:DUF1016 N-terminal domain-containing protein, partial [Bariatricus sp. HCP28S3_A7]|uniref:DUF1016 N-terminal domain-containing protein n=1 Tax=Bariatricus sp. HCP28S3_A7 TaxID=3438894 RepID=UPI003F8CD415
MENKLQNAEQNSIMDNFVKTDDILKDMCGIIESSQKAAHQAVNTLLVQRNWMIGYRIAEEEFGGQERSEYGLHVIKKLSKELTNRYGKGYDRGTLYRCLKFYKLFPEIVASLRQQSGAILSWTHYRILLQVEDKEVNILVTGNLDSGILETDIPEEGNSLIGLFTTYQVVRY